MWLIDHRDVKAGSKHVGSAGWRYEDDMLADGHLALVTYKGIFCGTLL